MTWRNPFSGISTLFIATLLVFSCQPLAAEYATRIKSTEEIHGLSFKCADARLWSYLRLGLNYLESPTPLLSPEATPPTYIHPDSKGFGAYGFSPGAYEDVQRQYPFFKQYSWQDIMKSSELYDLANQAFADLLLKNLTDYLPEGASKEEVFAVLHQAWNLGLSGFKNGRNVITSRARRALEFTAMVSAEKAL